MMNLANKLRELLFKDYLEDDEEILFVAHRHIFAFLRDSLRVFAWHFVLPLLVWFMFPQLLMIYGVWAFIGIIRLAFVLQDWYYDAWLLTNMGIVSVEWTGFFDRTSARVEYPSIEGVTYKIKGFWQTLFNYGNVTLAKFGGPSEMILKESANPKRVEKFVLKFQEKYMTHKNFTDQEVLKQLLSDLVATHVKKHGLPEVIREEIQKREESKKE